MRPINYFNDSFLNRWMTAESRADELAVPRPIVFGVGCGMYAYESASSIDVALKGFLLRIAQHVARGIEKDHHAVARQTVIRKAVGVLRSINEKAVCCAELLHRLDASGDGIVPKSCCLAEYQNAHGSRRICVRSAAVILLN